MLILRKYLQATFHEWKPHRTAIHSFGTIQILNLNDPSLFEILLQNLIHTLNKFYFHRSSFTAILRQIEKLILK